MHTYEQDEFAMNRYWFTGLGLMRHTVFIITKEQECERDQDDPMQVTT